MHKSNLNLTDRLVKLKDALGKNIHDVFCSGYTLELSELKQEVLETGEIKRKKINYLSSEDNVVCDVIVAPLFNNHNEVIGVSSIGVDITECEDLEKQVIHSEKLAELGQLATGISHEFNNILATIMGEVDMLLLREKDSNLSEKIIDRLKNIKERGQEAKKLAYDIMNISRHKEKENKLYSVKKIIDKILDVQERRLALENIKLVREYHSVGKVKMSLDELEQIFLNLIINARHAMKSCDGGELKISIKEVNKKVEIKVSDTGIGMDEKTKKQIFNPFFTTKADLIQDVLGIKGTGLGLSITSKIIKNHNGDLEVKSKKGKGSTFIIRLPIGKREKNGYRLKYL
jgi:signal transduction histidine kinase